jgi:FkbM family methyltransferase
MRRVDRAPVGEHAAPTSRYRRPQGMISYAQNAEDVVLRRALRDDAGFYVDVGAGDPVTGSVTKHFYDRGWCGLNVEPHPEPFRRLVRARPRDRNVCCCAGGRDGTGTLATFAESTGLSTTSEEIAGRLDRLGLTRTDLTVSMRRLDDLLTAHRVSRIDFLKIDVEGAEADVLGSFDLVTWAPRVCVIEVCVPGWWSIDETPEWDSRFVDAGYELTLFDGMNRFYARRDEPQLVRDLSYPANWLDRYVPYEWYAMMTESGQAMAMEALQTMALDADAQ